MKLKNKNINTAALSEEERRKMKRAALIKMLIIGIFLGVVIIWGSIAWFSSNDTTTAGGMGVSVGTDSYQIFPITGNASIYEQYRLDEIKSNDALVWNMSENSNMINYNSATDEGIGPGSYGKIEFLVNPRDTSINLDLTFQIIGYTYTEESTDENTNEVTPESMTPVSPTMQGYLTGHIFLFQSATPVYYTGTKKIKSYIYSDPILSGNSLQKSILNRTFTKTDEDNDGELDDNIPVVIYWVWPKTLSTLVDAASTNENVNIEPFCNWQSEASDPEYDPSYDNIVSDIILNPAHYFYIRDGETLDADDVDDIVGDYNTYGSKYDRVDNEIGRNVSFITLKMTTNESELVNQP